MDLLVTAGRTLGFSLAAGVNLYATVAILGLATRYGVVELPPQFKAFDNPWVIGVALVLYVVEFVADKVPWIDTVWDTVHTLVRPLGGALIAVSALGDAAPWLQGVTAIVGGTLAAGGHLTKAGTRAAVNVSPEPFTNWGLSLAEDAFVIGLVVLALKFPLVALGVTAICVVMILLLARWLLGWLRRAAAPPAVAVLALALLCSAAPRAQQTPPQQTLAQEPLFRGGANLVRLDVYASKGGVAVTDLTAADFDVSEDNAPQQVSSFEFVRARGVVPESARVEPNTVAASRERAALPDGRLFVLFLDTGHVQVEGSYHAQNPVSALLDRVVGEDDLVGVMTPDITARNITFSPRTGSVGEMLRANWHWGERGRMMATDPRDREIEDCYPDVGPTAGFAQPLLERRREAKVLASLTDLLEHLEGVREERTFVLLLSEGWLTPRPDQSLARAIDPPGGRRTVPGGPGDVGITPGDKLTLSGAVGGRSFESCERERGLLANQDFEMEFQQLTRLANRANVSFYPIDPRGLVVFDEAATARRSANPSLVADGARLARRQSALRALAEETDGAVVLNTNIERAMPRLLTDVGSYYLLGYVSTNQKLDGRYRRLTVRVKRPGIDVRARPGYLAPTAGDVAAAQTTAKPTATAGVNRALSSLPTGRRVAPIYLQAAGGAGFVQLTLEVDRATAAAPEWSQGGQVRVEIEPADGSRGAARLSETITLDPGTRVYTLRHPARDLLPAGAYQIRVQATPSGGTRGVPATASTLVTVPKAAALLGSAATASRRGPGSGRLFAPTADPRFRRTERIVLETPLVSKTATVTARLLNRVGQAMNVPVTLSERIDESLLLRVSVAELALAPLAPGEYVIEVTATEGAVTETISYAVRVVP